MTTRQSLNEHGFTIMTRIGHMSIDPVPPAAPGFRRLYVETQPLYMDVPGDVAYMGDGWRTVDVEMWRGAADGRARIP